MKKNKKILINHILHISHTETFLFTFYRRKGGVGAFPLFHFIQNHSISLSSLASCSILFVEQCFCCTLTFFSNMHSLILQYCSLFNSSLLLVVAADVLFQDVKCAFGFYLVWFGWVVMSSSVVVNILFFLSLRQVFEPENGIEVFLNCF